MAELTGVGHELKRAAEFPVAGSRASTHVEDVGGQRGQTFDVCVSRRRLDDSVASFILVLKDDQRGKTQNLCKQREKPFGTNKICIRRLPLTFS